MALDKNTQFEANNNNSDEEQSKLERSASDVSRIFNSTFIKEDNQWRSLKNMDCRGVISDLANNDSDNGVLSSMNEADSKNSREDSTRNTSPRVYASRFVSSQKIQNSSSDKPQDSKTNHFQRMKKRSTQKSKLCIIL
ncbi:unnamed protein product [Rotaria magnacalcarata]|uniref:Uncharacterized protein n=2 Tax=Rotaria magnacalcarata TaxID=392030 RepID=A0A815UWM2_9BILA|nr:unnamed protein product [Rotaria magnacalcarata]CAF2108468.1 unnamed protein product [Rotaria magnacalcarata]CAF2117415.1 unnamed protein product [Rotaria magnacalcarata]CAF2153804.1 unnamed protein product [Rotaria magnacalcarata]CAF4100043.1 unnamed protein product [Rotaria magnacalcarata]